MNYRPAPEIEQIARELIPRHHSHLESVTIEYVFRETAAKKGGREVLGHARLVTGLAAYLVTARQTRILGSASSGPFFVIEIAWDTWGGLTESSRVALVDHELSHCFVDQDGKLTIQPHDLEEFVAVYERHGAWRPEAKAFEAAVGEQLSLFDAMPTPA